MEKIAIIGGGQMGGALLRGLALKGGRKLAIVETDSTRAKALCGETTAEQFDSIREAMGWADAIILAIKPQVFPAIAPELMESRALYSKEGKVIISLMAGISLQQIRVAMGKRADYTSLLTEDALDEDSTVVVRTMPNLPLIVGAGAIAIANDGVPPKVLKQIVELFNSVGSAITVPESLLNAVTGLSGSGPAWVYQFIEGLTAGGVKMGLPREIAEELALKTIEGSVQMIRAGHGSAPELTSKVTSPGGTTVHGLHVLESGGFRGMLMEAIEAATWRSHELGDQ